jgi:outer membrane lipoprotein LolB
MNPSKSLINIVLVLFFLTGCTHLRKPAVFVQLTLQERQKTLSKITAWKMNGAISITSGNKRDIARFVWGQNKDRFHIIISGPLNIGGAYIAGDSTSVIFCRGNKHCTKAKSPEVIMYNQLGWMFPVSNIRYWILSLPVAKSRPESLSVDKYGHLVTLNQNGWQIKYSEFSQDRLTNTDLPNIIELVQGNVSIKIKITNRS